MSNLRKHLPSGKGAVKRVTDVDDIEATNVLLTVYNDTSTTHVATTSDHNNVTGIELDEVGDLARFKVELNGVVDLDRGIRVTDSATIVRNNEWYTLSPNTGLPDLAELVGRLLRSNTVNGEAALDIVEKTEVLARLLERNDIYSKL